MKVIHLKSQESVALPIYNSELSHLYEPTKKKPKTSKNEVRQGFSKGKFKTVWVGLIRPGGAIWCENGISLGDKGN